MLKKTITYTDFNGVERTEDCYFNLTEADLIEMETGVTGGLSEMLNGIINAKDQAALIKFFKELILKSYGIKSADGKNHKKSEAISEDFACSAAYPVLFMELATDAEAATAFVKGIIPAKYNQ
jgi:hypothetical protein